MEIIEKVAYLKGLAEGMDQITILCTFSILS